MRIASPYKNLTTSQHYHTWVMNFGYGTWILNLESRPNRVIGSVDDGWHNWLTTKFQPAVPEPTPLMINIFPSDGSTMSPMARLNGIVSMTHLGFGSFSRILLLLFRALMNEHLVALTYDSSGAPPHTKTPSSLFFIRTAAKPVLDKFLTNFKE